MVLAEIAFDYSVSLGSLLTIGFFLVGGTVFVMTVKSDGNRLKAHVDAKFESINDTIADFKRQMQKLGDVLVELTRQDGRQNTADERLLAQGKRVDSLAEAMRDMYKMMNDAKERIAALVSRSAA